MRAGSTRSQQSLLAALDATLGGGADAETVGAELFAVVAVVDRDASLRRALTEPTVPAEARRGIARSLFGGKISDATIEVVEAAVAERWSRSRDLVDCLEACAVSTEAARADRSGTLDAVEDELFRFGRILESNPALRDALSDRTAPIAARQKLLRGLLEGKVDGATLTLLVELLAGRQHSLAAGIEQYSEIVAARRERMVATAWVASPLSADQKERILRALAEQYHHEVHLNVIVDRSVLGGVRIAVGDDIIDSTIQTRLAQAERSLIR